MGPDISLSIADGAIAAWPGAWLGRNFRDILDTLGVDIGRALPERGGAGRLSGRPSLPVSR